jgi:hypothetical protein
MDARVKPAHDERGVSRVTTPSVQQEPAYAAFFASSIARQIFSGVSGMLSSLTP